MGSEFDCFTNCPVRYQCQGIGAAIFSVGEAAFQQKGTPDSMQRESTIHFFLNAIAGDVTADQALTLENLMDGQLQKIIPPEFTVEHAEVIAQATTAYDLLLGLMLENNAECSGPVTNWRGLIAAARAKRAIVRGKQRDKATGGSSYQDWATDKLTEVTRKNLRQRSRCSQPAVRKAYSQLKSAPYVKHLRRRYNLD